MAAPKPQDTPKTDAETKVEVKAFEAKKIKVVLEGQLLPIITVSQNPNDEAKEARGMKCMMCLDARVVKSITTGLTYVFPPLEAVWVHKLDVNLCGGKGAVPYRKMVVADEGNVDNDPDAA